MMTKEDYLNEYKTHKSMRDNVKRDNYRLQLDGEQSFGDIIQAKI